MDNRLFTVPKDLILKYGTNDPFVIAGNMKNVEVRFFDAQKQKGFCTNILNNYFIFINRNLSRQMQRMVCGHELGHILFHRDRLKPDKSGRMQKLAEWELFDIKDRTEYEANLFLANLLIDTEELKEMICAGYDIVRIASVLEVNVNLVALKTAETKFDGVDVPFIPKKDFLGSIADRADSIG